MAGAILLCLGLIYRFLPFFQEIVSPGNEIELRERQLIKYQKMVEYGSGLGEALSSLRHALKQAESRLLTGKTPSLAAVDIQNILHKIADKSKVDISSLKVLKPREVGKKEYLEVSVEFSAITTIRQLKEVLYRIEASSKYLTVRKLQTRFNRGRVRRVRSVITVCGIMKTA